MKPFSFIYVSLLLLCTVSTAPAQQFMGCYKDQGDPYGTKGRDLSGHVFRDSHMTVERCLSECGSRGYRYAGVQYGEWCFCDNDYGAGGPADNCNKPCAGNSNEICGGAWANSVYQVSATPSAPPPPSVGAPEYVGCYKDQGDPYGTRGRDLSGFVFQDNGMTVERCAAECRSRGFRYAGTQYGKWCFCDNDYGASGPADNCNVPCAGNAGETCGGAWANSVYRLK